MARDLADPGLAVVLGSGEGANSTLLPLRARGRARVTVVVVVGAPPRALAVELEVSARGPGGDESAPVATPLVLQLASAAAARALGKDPRHFSWSARVVDGAAADRAGALPLSASAALAAGFVAALTGASIDPGAAVLGVSLPDGGVGGGGGPLAAHRAALTAAGVRRVGFPDSGAAGVAAGSLADLAAAYHFLTGETLPVSSPMPEPALQLSAAIQQALAAEYQRQQTMLAADWVALLMLDNTARVPPSVRALAESAQRAARRAEELRRAQAPAAALYALGAARGLTAAVLRTMAVIGRVQLGHVDEALEELRAQLAIDGEAVAALVALGEGTPTSAGATLQQLAAATTATEVLAQAAALRARAEVLATELGALRGADLAELGAAVSAAQLSTKVAPVLAAAGELRTRLELAVALAALPDPGGGPAPVLAEPSAELARAWRREFGAGAVPGVDAALELALVNTAADGWRASASTLPGAPAQLARWGDGPARALGEWALQLAGQQAAWQLWARRDLAGDGEAASLATLVRGAELRARRTLHATQVAIGHVPLSARLAWAAGRELATADDPDLQRRALRELWRACQLADAARSLTVGAPAR